MTRGYFIIRAVTCTLTGKNHPVGVMAFDSDRVVWDTLIRGQWPAEVPQKFQGLLRPVRDKWVRDYYSAKNNRPQTNPYSFGFEFCTKAKSSLPEEFKMTGPFPIGNKTSITNFCLDFF